MNRTRFIAALCLLLASCEGTTGTHIGNPEAVTSGFSITFTSSDGDLLLADEAGLPLKVTAVLLSVEGMELELDSSTCQEQENALDGGAVCLAGSANDRTITIPGPFILDLVAGASPLEAVRLPAETYRRIDVGTRQAVAGPSLPPEHELVGRTLVLHADFTYMDVAAELRVHIGTLEQLRLESPTGFDAPEDGALLVELDLDQWFSEVDLAACLDSGELTIEDGVLLIDGLAGTGTCQQLDNRIAANIHASARVGSQRD